MDGENDCWKKINYKQLIPYVLLQKADGKFACYQRHGTEIRLHGKWSAGIGGHIDEPDQQTSLKATLETGMLRELKEELLDFDKKKFPELSWNNKWSRKRSRLCSSWNCIYCKMCGRLRTKTKWWTEKSGNHFAGKSLCCPLFSCVTKIYCNYHLISWFIDSFLILMLLNVRL